MKDCNQCGKCCTHYGGGGGLSAEQSDVRHWRESRPDIARYVRDDGEIWFSPVTGQQLARCPWLRKLPNQVKYTCRIYNDRPQECRHYPVTIEQMVQVDCEMLEPHDLVQPHRAQVKLDALMRDSRPACARLGRDYEN